VPSQQKQRQKQRPNRRKLTLEDFESAVSKYYPRIVLYCGKSTNWHDEHADLAQQTFLKARRAFHKFEGRSSLYTWFHTIAQNLVIDWRRKQKQVATVPLDKHDWGGNGATLDGWPTEYGESAIAHSDLIQLSEASSCHAIGDPLRAVFSREIREIVEGALDEMTDKERQAYELQVDEGKNTREVAELLGVAEQTVRNRLHLARKRIRRKLVEANVLSG
jgi:RNA polymerase sigma-70 factor (ECF subfamily)